ncbi:uncharacterized protein LOC118415177 [Branchiostoma floridae]|uniref:1-alkyl-2-acetylglycerophosphocholine esterase n=1 Tax=Branchiostoma floridae TaxID=7739 RepID=A0A9J7L4Q0_BRAFL|nr:uncharacterized protein LOC118415177 [Branchiostoma floridae]
MGRETSGDSGTPESETTKRYRTRSGNTKTKGWNTSAKNIPEFETIIEDHTDASKSKVCSLKFRTSKDRVPVWIDASKAVFSDSLGKQTGYKFTWKGSQLSVSKPTETGDNAKILTIHFYNTGTILIQGNGSNWYAREIFPQVKELVSNNQIGASCDAQDGGHDNEDLATERTETIDDNLETIGTSSQDDAPAITTSGTSTEPTKTSSVTVDPTQEKENSSQNTIPKSPITSPTLRRVLGGLENIILTPLSKVRNSGKNKEGRPQHESRSRRALPTDDVQDKSTSEKCNSVHETLYTSLVDDLNNLKSLVFSNKVTMDNQQKCINDLTANVQNRKKEVEKQARQIQDLNTELERQREISKDLAKTISSQKADQEALQAQLTLLLNQPQPQSVSSTASRVCSNSQQDDSRIQRLYAEVVSGLEHPNSSPATQIPKPSDSEAPTTTNTQPRAPTTAISQPPVTTDTQPPATPPTRERVVPDKQTPVTPAAQTSGNVKVRVLADSLWNDVDPTIMFKDRTATITKSTTLRKASENALMLPDNNTELVIIHVGSNDMDNTKDRNDSVNICVEQTTKLIDRAKTSYPNAKIAMSQVLPRGSNTQSTLNKNIATYNNAIEQSCLEDNKLIYIRHRLLSQDRSLYKRDGIHLTPDAGGVKLMVADVKRTLRHRQEAMDSRQRTKQARGPQWMPSTQPYPRPGQHPPPLWNTPRNPPQMYPRNPARAPSRQGTDWNNTRDKQQTVEKLLHMLTDFLKQ